MHTCNCPSLSVTAPLPEVLAYFKIHYAGVPEALTFSQRLPTLSVPDRQARLYQHRHLYRQAVLANVGVCPACGTEVSRFTADFAPDGHLRGALCRACMEMARLVTYDDQGRVTWSTNPVFCQMAAGYFVDHCRSLAVDHTEKVGEVCERCGSTGWRWLQLGQYLADRAGEPYDVGARWHLVDDEPVNEKGAEAAAPAPLFLAPSD